MTLVQTCWRLSGLDVRLQVLHCAPLDLVTPTKDKYNPLASPAWGSNGDGLGGIAPALIVTAEFDRLRDEAAAYARKLKDVGALAEYHQVGGLDHGYNIMTDAPRALDATRRVYQLIADHVVRATSGGPL